SGITHEEVARHLNAMDILCAPSQTTGRWREQFGRMLIEALSCGVPVVASDSGEIPNVLADAGIIVAEGDQPAWTRRLDPLLDNPTRLEHLVRRGRQLAIERFAWRVVARQHLEFFAEVIDRRRYRLDADAPLRADAVV